MNLLQELQNDVKGLEVLKDWIGGTGEPVIQIRADHRAYVCTSGNDGKPCPLNLEPNWWDRVKSTIAFWIRKQLELKNRLKLRVAAEDSLNMCAACGCCLKLKVWTPIAHIKAHLPPENIAKTPSYCWMRKEIEP